MASSSRNSNPRDSQNVEYYNCKWGNVAIFNGENYPLWKQTCSAALIGAGGMDFITGAEALRPNPSEAQRNRLSIAIVIIYSSVSEVYKSDLVPGMANHSPQQMWEIVQGYSKSHDRVYIAGLTSAFYEARFDPTQ